MVKFQIGRAPATYFKIYMSKSIKVTKIDDYESNIKIDLEFVIIRDNESELREDVEKLISKFSI